MAAGSGFSSLLGPPAAIIGPQVLHSGQPQWNHLMLQETNLQEIFTLRSDIERLVTVFTPEQEAWLCQHC